MNHTLSHCFAALLICGHSFAQTPYQEAYLKTSTLAVGTAGSQFGYSVDVDGNFAVAGAPYEDSGAVGVNTTYPMPLADSGAVCVFRRQGTWAPEAYLKPFNVDNGDHFGWSTAISGNTVVVGAPDEASATVGEPFGNTTGAAGAAYVFVRDEATGTWSQQAFLKPSVATAYQQFGYSVDVEGDLAVVGAPSFSYTTDKAYVFRRVGATWTQEAVLAPTASPNGKAFGTSVAISGDTVVVGAPYDSDPDYMKGSVYVFKRNSATGNWDQQAFLAPAHYTNDFGAAVAISGDVLVVGTPRDGSNATGVGGDMTNTSSPLSGAAFVYRRTTGVWSFEAYLKASNNDSEDHFGSAVAVDGDSILVGAVYEGSSATGVNGNQTLNDAYRSGAVYRFTRTAGVWAGSGYIKASNPGGGISGYPGDAFGGPTTNGYVLTGGGLALDGSTAIVGAALEDSGARGVGGNQADESAEDAGAAYIFENISPQVPDIALEFPSGIFNSSGGANVSFGYTSVGGDAQRALRIHNIGNGVLTLGSIGFLGPNAADFQVLYAPPSVGAGASTIILIRFVPTASGNKSAVLNLNSNDPDESLFLVNVAGLGIEASCGEETAPSPARIRYLGVLKASNADEGIPLDDGPPFPSGDGSFVPGIPDLLPLPSSASGSSAEPVSATGDQFGWTMDMDGDTLVVGAPFEDGNGTAQSDNSLQDAGAAYIFVRNPATGNWSQQAYLKPSNPGAGDRFGYSVAIAGDTVIIGAPREDGGSSGANGPANEAAMDSGAAYIFVRSGVAWSQQAYLKSEYPANAVTLASGTLVGQGFGIDVDISGENAIVGAYREEVTPPGTPLGEGTAYVFGRTGTNWTQEERLAPPIPGTEKFGLSVSLDGTIAAVSSVSMNPLIRSGLVFLFEELSSANWIASYTINGASFDYPNSFGNDVALDNDTIAGPRLAVVDGELGTVRTFLQNPGDGTWAQEQALNTSDAPQSVALDGKTMLIGLPYQSSNAVGINGVSSGDFRSASGAVLHWEILDGTWTQKAVVKSPNPDPEDLFGFSVALSTGTGFAGFGCVGAPAEDSPSPGELFLNTESGSGAVYTYAGLVPEADIAISLVAGGADVVNNSTIDFGVVPTGRNKTIQFAIKNLGDRNLNFTTSPFPDVTITGDTTHFTAPTVLSEPITMGSSSPFTVQFHPLTSGAFDITLTIYCNDPTESPFVIHFTGYAPTPTDDLDGDGIPDAEEFDLEAAGFSAGQDDSTRASTITAHADVFDLYDPTDMQALQVDTPLIFRDSGTNVVTLTLGIQKSPDLLDFDPFPATTPQISVNPEGKIQFTFPSPDPRAFFRVEAR